MRRRLGEHRARAQPRHRLHRRPGSSRWSAERSARAA